MRTLRAAVCLAALLLPLRSFADDYPPGSVGDLGDPACLQFEGLRTFTPDQVRDGLTWNLDFLLAAHPLAPLRDYLDRVRNDVLQGFRHGGFPDARVEVEADAKARKIAVRVEEGKRYTCGPVRVTGAKTVPAEKIVERLTQPHVPWDSESYDVKMVDGSANLIRSDKPDKPKEPEKPIWKPGEPAPMDDVFQRKLPKILQFALMDFGLFFPTVHASIIRDPAAGVAGLEVIIEDEGPKGTVGSIEVVGAHKDPPEEVQKYLGLKPGISFDHEMISRTRELLYRSGRYLSYKVVPKPPELRDGQLKLVIEVREYDKAPPLGAALSPEVEISLRTREWLAKVLALGIEDVYVDSIAPDGARVPVEIEVAMSSRRGALCLLWRREAGTRAEPLYAVAMDADIVGLYSPHRRQWFGGRRTRGLQVRGELGISVLDDIKDPLRPFGVRFSFGCRSVDEDTSDARPVDLNFRLDPVAFLGMVYQEGTTCTYSADRRILTMQLRDDCLQLDAATGRILEWTFKDAESGFAGHVRFEESRYGRLKKVLQDATAEHVNVCDANRPVGSFCEFVAADAPLWAFLYGVENPRRVERCVSVIQRALGPHILDPLDRFIAQGGLDGDDTSFTVPFDTPENVGLAYLIKWFSAPAFKIVGWCVPRGSWPWTLSRELMFALGGRGAYFWKEMSRIYESPNVGPIGFYVTSKLLTLIDLPSAKTFAERGLTRLSPEEFRKDMRLCFEGDTILAQCAARLAAAVADLDDADVAALVEVLSPEEGKALARCVRIVKEGKGKPPADVLPAAFDAWWEGALRKDVEAGLRAILTTPAPEPKPDSY